MKEFKNVRNVAIIAHVDHGKTTLIDSMLRQSGIFRENEQVNERVMDSNDLEKERGITIFSKNTAIYYNDIKINIIDTPGHADFGGEVERILKMVDGVLLLVDSFEGPMPQTRFVLSKALSLDLKPIVVINKLDRQDARPEEVLEKVFELFLDLDAGDHQLDFPVIYASSRLGCASENISLDSNDLNPLFEAIIKYIPLPGSDISKPLQYLVSSINYDDYVGRIAIGKIEKGIMHVNDQIAIANKNEEVRYSKISRLYVFEGLDRTEVKEAYAGDIVAVSGIAGINIGDTICDVENIEPLDFVKVDEPTISMVFLVNNSPFAGKEGTYVTSRHLRERLFKEMETNVSMLVEETDSTDSFKVLGRGELHLSILIETMRREGYEFQVSKPEAILKEKDGVMVEPVEYLLIDVPEEFTGVVIEKVGSRKGEMINMGHSGKSYTRLEFKIPSRCLIGYRSELLTDTKGTGIISHVFDGYEPYKGIMARRQRGSLIAFESGEAVAYGLYNANERGILFISPGTRVYEGMIVGENARSEDIVVNVCKKKHLTNIRSSGSDDLIKFSAPKSMSLEECLEFIEDDELIEITPKNIRLRKKILDSSQRAKIKSKEEN